eukprot:TRINITY_DN15265_c0_g2_i2.p1 TRINITY_DN15265_c0_g2~~TRINITY_DN15265_c0_g2_i2.p1  ORF type:complete len:399 (+),score=87.63 TRINITY_DN15265_c0_g2_i2:80-1276(+)
MSAGGAAVLNQRICVGCGWALPSECFPKAQRNREHGKCTACVAQTGKNHQPGAAPSGCGGRPTGSRKCISCGHYLPRQLFSTDEQWNSAGRKCSNCAAKRGVGSDEAAPKPKLLPELRRCAGCGLDFARGHFDASGHLQWDRWDRKCRACVGLGGFHFPPTPAARAPGWPGACPAPFAPCLAQGCAAQCGAWPWAPAMPCASVGGQFGGQVGGAAAFPSQTHAPAGPGGGALPVAQPLPDAPPQPVPHPGPHCQPELQPGQALEVSNNDTATQSEAGEYRWSCAQCGEAFRSQLMLKFHSQKAHSPPAAPHCGVGSEGCTAASGRGEAECTETYLLQVREGGEKFLVFAGSGGEVRELRLVAVGGRVTLQGSPEALAALRGRLRPATGIDAGTDTRDD